MIKRKFMFFTALPVFIASLIIILTGTHVQIDAVLATNQASSNIVISNIGINAANGSGVIAALTKVVNAISFCGVIFSFISKKSSFFVKYFLRLTL